MRTEVEVRTIVDAPPETVFDLELDVAAHAASLPGTGETAVTSTGRPELGPGDEVTFRARHLGIWWTMTSTVTVYDRPRRFVDEQVRGPLRTLRHEHLFETLDTGSTHMIDRMAMTLPFGPLGWVAGQFVAAPYMRRLLRQRAGHIKRLAETSRGSLDRVRGDGRVPTPSAEGTTLADVTQMLDAFDEAGIRSWVEGGWGVDALIGHQTRRHRDVDVDIDVTTEAGALDILRGLGYQVWADHRPNRIEMVVDSRAYVVLHPIRFDDDGSARQPGESGEVHYFPARYFTTGSLAGRPVGCFTIEAQRHFRTGHTQRPVDVHDLAQLDRLTALDTTAAPRPGQ